MLLFFGWMGCGEALVGVPCASDQDCDPRLTCDTDLPDGYCTESCDTPGQSCGAGPVAAYCADNGAGLACSAYCDDSSDCRDGYDCVDVPGTSDPALPGGPPYKACVAPG